MGRRGTNWQILSESRGSRRLFNRAAAPLTVAEYAEGSSRCLMCGTRNPDRSGSSRALNSPSMGQLVQSRGDGSDRAAVQANGVSNGSLTRPTWPVRSANDAYASRDSACVRGAWPAEDVRSPLDHGQDGLGTDCDGPTRIQRSGSWCAGKLVGDYIVRAEWRGLYLELHLTRGRFTREHVSRLRSSLAEVSVRRFSGSQRLALLRQAPSPLVPGQGSGLDWVTELVVSLQQALPHLRLDQGADPAEASARPQKQQLPTEPVPALPISLSTVRSLPDDSAPPVLSQATAALERACFREAERFGNLAAARGDPEASEFLEALRAVRRAAKVVRRYPRDPRARFGLAHAYFLGDAGQAAMREAIEAVRLDPRLGEAHALIGLEHVYRGERVRANEAWERARDSSDAGPLQETLLVMLHEPPAELALDEPADLPLDRPSETVRSGIPHHLSVPRSLARSFVTGFERIWRRP